MCEYWLFLFSIHWDIGCSGWRLLTETCNYRNSLFETFLSLLWWKAPTAGSGTPPLTKPNQKDSEFSSFPPTLFAKFNLPQHRLALRSNKREAKGRSALKATVEEGDEKKRERAVQMSFLWTKKSVAQMSEGKQEDDLSFGAVPHWKAVCTGNLRQ